MRQWIVILVIVVAAAAAAAADMDGKVFLFPPELYAVDESAEQKTTLTVLSANVGNADIFRCGEPYIYKLCRKKIEKEVAAALAAIKPDIVALQEVFNDDLCEGFTEKNKERVCYGNKDREPHYQVRRLLGDDYTIVCDDRSHFECLGIRKEVGVIPGCEPGGLCLGSALVAAPAPESCDAHPSIFGVDAVVGDVSIRIVDAHPSASILDCRAGQLQGLFEGYAGAPPVADPALNLLIMGDINLTPFTDYTDSSIDIWRAHVGDGKAFYYLSGPAEHDPPWPTNAGRAIDHVITNFATGHCVTMGRSSEARRLDGTFGDTDPEGTDHSPLICELRFDKP